MFVVFVVVVCGWGGVYWLVGVGWVGYGIGFVGFGLCVWCVGFLDDLCGW